MASFSRQVKDELLDVRLRRDDDAKKLVQGATLAAATLKFSRRARTWGLHYVSENEPLISFIAKLAQKNYSLESIVSLNEHERLNARNTELFLYGDGLDRLSEDSGLFTVDENGERSYEPHMPEGLDTEHGFRAFLRGVFLMCGTVSDPEKGCHAEMVFKNEFAAKSIAELMTKRNIPPKLSKRRNLFVVYIKNGDTVEDFLTFMGAGESMLVLSEHRMIRDIKNNSNREVNCFNANTEKTVQASGKQTEDIELIISRLGYDAFDDDLYELAMARLDYPEMSLTQLAERLGIGRSAANYRFKKIARIADRIRDNKDITE